MTPPTRPEPTPPPSEPAMRGDQPTKSVAAPNSVGDETATSPPMGDDATSGGFGFLSAAQQIGELGRLGPYRILDVLGQGGMGMVFRAEDPRLKRQIALKIMLPQHALNALAKSRFLREAQAQAQVEHDHIIPIFEVEEANGTPYIAMPMLKGQTLSNALKQTPRPPLAETLRVCREIAEGLQAAHEKGLMHRDIKPGNIWLEGDRRRVKILDFGLARAEAEQQGDAAEPLTASGAIVGTPQYMSPEQGRGEAVDHRTDLFSLGVVLYQMLTGQLPFRGATTMAILTSLAVDHPPPPSHLVPGLPPRLDALAMTLLAKNPGDRPGSAQLVADELRRIESMLSSTAVVVPMAAAVGANPWTELDATDPMTLAAAPTPSAAPATGGAKWLLLALGLLVILGGSVLAWQIIKITTPKGTLIIQTDDPDVEVRVTQDGAVLFDKTKQREIVLKAGEYGIELAEGKDGLRLSTEKFTIEKDGKTRVRVTLDRKEIGKAKPVVPDKSVPPSFTLPVEGIGAQAALRSSATSFAAAPEKGFAEFRGVGRIEFPPVDTTTYALDLDIEVRGVGELAVVLGDLGVFHPELRLHRVPNSTATRARLIRQHNNTWHIRAKPPEFTELRHSLSLVVTPKGTLLFRNGEFQRLTPVGASGGIRFLGLANDTDATIHSAKLRAPTANELKIATERLGEPLPPEETGAETTTPPSFLEVHGATKDALLDWSAKLPKGMRPAWIATRAGGPDGIFDAVAVPAPEDIPWTLAFRPHDDETPWVELRKTHRAAMLAPHHRDGKYQHIALGVKDGGAIDYWWGGMDFVAEKIKEGLTYDRDNNGVKERWLPVSVSAYKHPEGNTICELLSTWLPDQGCEAHLDLAPNELVKKVAEYRKKDWRPHLINIHACRKDARFVAVFTENKTNESWDFTPDLAVADFEKELTARQAKDQRPRCVCSFVEDGKVSYTVVWDAVPNSDRVAAEYVLSVGGSVQVNDVGRDIKALADLPKEPFRLTYAWMRACDRVSDAGLAAFRGCRHLTHLDLVQTPATGAAMTHFRENKNLVVLDLVRAPIDDAGLAHFADFDKLLFVWLGGTKVTDVGAAHFKNAKNLLFLDFTNTGVTDVGMAHYQQFTTLQFLAIAKTAVGDTGLARFANCVDLETLHADGSGLTDTAAGTLRKFTKLKLLTLKDTKITAKAIDALKAALPQCKIEWDGGTIEPTAMIDPMSQLVQWVIAHNGSIYVRRVGHVSKANLALLPADLSAVEGVTFSDLKAADLKTAYELLGKTNVRLAVGFVGGDLRDEDVERLTQTTMRGRLLDLQLRSCNGLTGRCLEYARVGSLVNLELNLNNHGRISEEDIRRFTAPPSPTLTKLHLGFCGLTDAAIQPLEVLPLAQLNLSGNRDLTATGLGVLLKALPNLTNLSLNQVTASNELIDAVAGMPTLAELYLSGSILQDAHLATLAHRGSLRLLLLTDNKALTKPAIDKLAAALPKCKIEWDGGIIEPTAK